MIHIEVVLDRRGLLRACHVEGHAGYGRRGSDVVCATVSALARTAVQVLSRRKDLSVGADAPARGEVWFEVTLKDEKARMFLEAVTAFLLEGFQGIVKEYPDYCTVSIRTEGRL